MRLAPLVVAAGLPFLSTASLAAQGIAVGERIRVASAPRQFKLVEPHLAVHPDNPQHLLAAAIITPHSGSFEERTGRQYCAAYLSVDGGRRWESRDFTVTWCFDPWVAITPAGAAAFSLIGSHPQVNEKARSGLVVFHSPDGGRSWRDPPIGLGRGHDHPTMTVDLSESPRRGWIYLTSGQDTRSADGKRRSSVFVERSRDGGTAFDQPARILPNNLHNLSEMPVVLSSGELVVSFVDAARAADTTGRPVLLERRRAWVARSADGGQTFAAPLLVTEACGPPPFFQLSALAADGSTGPFRDRLYFACRRMGEGPIVVAASADRGELWSDPVPVPGMAVDSSVSRIPAIAVSGSGLLGVAWMTTRSAPPGTSCQELHFTASLDGGTSFVPVRQVAEASCIATSGSSFDGDYFGLVGLPRGRFQLLWGEPSRDAGVLWTVTVSVEGAPALPR